MLCIYEETGVPASPHLNVFMNAEFYGCVGQNSFSASMCLNPESSSCVGTEGVLLVVGMVVIVAVTSGAD